MSDIIKCNQSLHPFGPVLCTVGQPLIHRHWLIWL